MVLQSIRMVDAVKAVWRFYSIELKQMTKTLKAKY